MERITAATRERLSAKAEELDDLLRTYETLLDLRARTLEMRLVSPVAKMPGKVCSFMQIGLRRTLELAESFIRELNAGSFTPAFVLSRSTFETGALLLDASIRIQDVTAAGRPDALDILDKHLMDLLFGFKSPAWDMSPDNVYQAKNVVTIIDRITKKIDQPFASIYGRLSEHAHPNYFGMMAAYQKTNETPNPVVTFVDKPLDDDLLVKVLRWLFWGLGSERTWPRSLLKAIMSAPLIFSGCARQRSTRQARGLQVCRTPFKG